MSVPQYGLFDGTGKLCKHPGMSPFIRKFIAVLLALWLPLFSGSVLAASVSMQCHSGPFHSGQIHHDSVRDVAMPDMQQGDDCEQHVAQNGNTTQDHQGSCQGGSCDSCGVCHLACSGYLAISCLSALNLPLPDVSLAIYLLSFDSTTSIPLLPPPLARA